MPKYKYGEEVEYEFTLLNFSDKEKLQKFNCGNKKLNSFIHDEIIPNNEVINEDGLIYYYLSDCIMGEVIQHCKLISEEYALVNYILLYADKKAYRFYKRNFFLEFELYMEQENNMEIKENIPMYMKL